MAKLPAPKMTPAQYRELKRKEYEIRLTTLPPSGGGGCHAAMLGVANVGIKAGMTERQIFDDLRHYAHGDRHISDREICDAVRKAADSKFIAQGTPRFAPAIKGDTARSKIIEKGRGATEADIWEASPIRIDWPHNEDGWRLLEHLYLPQAFLFIGDDALPGKMGATVRNRDDWVTHFQSVKKIPYPKIMPNSLTGLQGITKDGKLSLRADSCINDFRFIVCEFDSIPLEDQFAFWAAARLPVAAIIHSGKKSLHAWVRVDCRDAAEWEAEVERKLFPQVLQPLGLDGACKNEARLSRMAGHVRWLDAKTSSIQRLLYLAPEGRPVRA